jgi:hypothetical protein
MEASIAGLLLLRRSPHTQRHPRVKPEDDFECIMDVECMNGVKCMG